MIVGKSGDNFCIWLGSELLWRVVYPEVILVSGEARANILVLFLVLRLCMSAPGIVSFLPWQCFTDNLDLNVPLVLDMFHAPLALDEPLVFLVGIPQPFLIANALASPMSSSFWKTFRHAMATRDGTLNRS